MRIVRGSVLERVTREPRSQESTWGRSSTRGMGTAGPRLEERSSSWVIERRRSIGSVPTFGQTETTAQTGMC
jgi:acyl-coenzyme A synthetase/AMP-(fatty) acid ligase